MTRKTRGHEPLRLAVAVVARRDEQAVRRQEPEQHAAGGSVHAGAHIHAVEAASQRRMRVAQRLDDVEDVAHVVEDVGRVRR